jgi:phosphate-selective porin OprO/OprP
MNFIPYYLGLSVLGLGISSPYAHAEDADHISNETLLKRIEELEQRLKVSERKDELDHEAAAEKAKTAASVSAGAGGFQIRSADTNFVLKVRGYIQADSRWFIDDKTAVNDTFLLRRVRPIIEGTVWDKFDYRLMLDFGSGVTSSASNDAYVQDAYVNARFFPQLQVQAGKFKEPVGLERLQSGSNLLFVERAYPSQLVPNRDVGLQIQGDFFEGALSYVVGLFNGVQDGASGDIDATDDDKDIAARLFAQPFKNSDVEALRGFGFGLAGTYGDHAGALRSFVSPGQQTFFNYYSGTGTNAVTVADGKQWRIAPQAYYYWRSLGVFGEYTISAPEVRRTGGGLATPATTRLQHTAWQVAASYFLTGEDNSFKAVTPKHPFTLGGDGWGAWEIAARVSELKLDGDTFPLFADERTSARKAFSYTVGLNWHLNRNFKVNLNYEHTDFKGGSSNSVLAQDENVIMTRAQISF